jgi:hypothetical protein
MRQFSDLPHREQALLLLRVVQVIADGENYKCIEEVASERNISPEALWHQICADEGLVKCQPWTDFPNLPRNLPIQKLGSTEHPLISKSLTKLTNALANECEPIHICQTA